jgi:hypothetical protein
VTKETINPRSRRPMLPSPGEQAGRGDDTIPAMTFMTVTYELQDRLKPEQFRALGQFANTYGLQKFSFDEKTNRLQLDYDASRLEERVVEHVLREAKIPVLRKLEPGK